MKELKIYIKEVLGLDLDIRPMNQDKLKKLPVYFKSEYRLYQSILFDKDLLFIEVGGGYTTEKLRKHLEIIKQVYHANPVAIIGHLDAYKRLRLIAKKIPFIVPGKQMYMPDLLIDLREFGLTPGKQPKSMSPATQFLLLYHLQVESLEGINLKGIAEKLNYDSATITRTAGYLQNMQICNLEGTKDKLLYFKSERKELWEKLKPLMHSPVKKTSYYNGRVADQNLYKANNNALAHYSDLNDDAVEHYAVRQGYHEFIDDAFLTKTAILEGNICIEEWKYNPGLLTKDDFVDPLSLYLCFKDNPDERVQIALEQMINSIKW